MKTSPQSFSRTLLSWHKNIHRPLPWVGERNPYFIWLSEVILQQTSTKQGLPYFMTFKKRFPNVKSLAKASEDEVLKLWQGLGYYTRARNLHASSKHICDELNGEFPTTYEGIRELKGVGDYTAAAIASFAYNLPYPVVDGNVFRVLSRYFGVTTPIDTTGGKKEYNALAENLIPKKYPALYNQAIMDFGALQCVPVRPECGRCPFQDSCFARKKNLVSRFPKKSKKIEKRNRYFHYLIVKQGRYTYLSKREEEDIWKNLYEFPMIENKMPLTGEELVQTDFWREFIGGNSLKSIKFSGNFKQILTHQKIHASFFEIHVSKEFKGNGLTRVNGDYTEKFAFPRVILLYLSDKTRYLNPLLIN